MLPQYYQRRTFHYQSAAEGMRMILWGLFKKVVIADTCAGYANDAFSNYQHRDGLTLIIGAIYFAFQIYGDFSGYTDIARGLGKLFGFQLNVNFLYPYFSKNIADFWRRWHISLTTWFRDYVYFPLGGSRKSKAVTIRNTFIVFLVSGLWHGANWTFVCWGLLHALFMLPLLLFDVAKKPLYTPAAINKVTLHDVLQMGITFMLAVIAWVFFRAPDVGAAFGYLRGMANISALTLPGKGDAFLLVLLLLVVDWVGRKHENALEGFLQQFPKAKYALYLSLGLLIYINFSRQTSFIYFQF
jgi:D-alanyl-lipoteichoic acid acyltransferase DltB (MBOAT superfamily)